MWKHERHLQPTPLMLGGLPEPSPRAVALPAGALWGPASLHRAAFVCTPPAAKVSVPQPLSSSHGAAPTYLANLTVAAFRGTNPV